MKILVLGGTAWLSHEIAKTLLARGHDVTCAARGSDAPQGARVVNLNRDLDDALRPLTGQRWDAVVDVARQPGHVRRAVRDLASLVDRYLFVSTGNVYASQDEVGADESAPLNEPLLADTFSDPEEYGPAKVACENAVLATFGADRSLIARAGLIGGPGDHTQRTTYWPWRFAHPAREGSVLTPDAPDLPVAVIDVRDLAQWLVRCIERAASGVYNATGSAVALPEHLAAAHRAAHSSAVAVRAPEQWLQDHDVAEWGGPRSMPLWLMDRSWYGFNGRSNTRAVATGLSLRPLEETLRDGLSWRESAPAEEMKAGLEDADEGSLLSALGQR
ncbi:oxidoreductase [Rathayibacter sp. VKM Ac-2878]|nr:oxidoreductase [Rathayibacter sp. VKM Ac-2879]MBF4504435.1 oxidoreductase [Rathayibacter sp. VKM Ac-2878]